MHTIRLSLLLSALLCATTSANAAPEGRYADLTCGSKDGGKTCDAFDQTYLDGTADACGRVPNGPEFAVKLAYTMSGNTKCETVTKTSHPEVMPVGEKFCTIILSRDAAGTSFRYTDDEPSKIRKSFKATQAAKWCQPLIDALK